MPGCDKTYSQFPIQFFIISRSNHSKWFSHYIDHITGYVLTLKETMNQPYFPDAHAQRQFRHVTMCTKISHKEPLGDKKE